MTTTMQKPNENKDYAVRLKNLSKSFKGQEVLKGIDLEIEKGTVFCLLGTNGSGKTTMIKILSTLLLSDGGTAEIFGFDVKKQAVQARSIMALTGQYAAVDKLLTGRENVEMAARLFHVKDYKKRGAELLECVGLSDEGEKKAGAYSGGMLRRLDIAMSLAANPKLLFLDEPTTGLDPQSRLKMWELVKNLTGGGMTVFLTTQYLDEAERLADRIAILKDGKIIKDGTPRELKTIINETQAEFEFYSVETFEIAKKRIEKISGIVLKADIAALLLTVTADNGVKIFMEVLNEVADLELASIVRHKPSLEEAFLKLTSVEGDI